MLQLSLFCIDLSQQNVQDLDRNELSTSAKKQTILFKRIHKKNLTTELHRRLQRNKTFSKPDQLKVARHLQSWISVTHSMRDAISITALP